MSASAEPAAPRRSPAKTPDESFKSKITLAAKKGDLVRANRKYSLAPANKLPRFELPPYLEPYLQGATVSLPVGDLFCGPGGIRVGCSQAAFSRGGVRFEFSHAWANDYHESTCDTYKQNAEMTGVYPDAVWCEDVEKFVGRFPELAKVAGLTFGFPCNDFSVVGERRGMSGHFGGLYTHCVKAVHFFKPLFFIAENVSGLLSVEGGEAFKRIRGEFWSEGYELTTHLYRFEQYGVPQFRKRIIMVGVRKDLHDIGVSYEIPAPTHSVFITAREALANIPPDAANQERTKQSEAVKKRLAFIGPGQNAWNAPIPEDLRIKKGNAALSCIYRRLDPDQPAYTVTGSGGGGTHMYHYSENRALTNRERARLQSFPDWFVFRGTKEQVRRQIGMAVPPEGARVIAESIMQSLIGEAYGWVPESHPFVPARRVRPRTPGRPETFARLGRVAAIPRPSVGLARLQVSDDDEREDPLRAERLAGGDLRGKMAGSATTTCARRAKSAIWGCSCGTLLQTPLSRTSPSGALRTVGQACRICRAISVGVSGLLR